MMLRSSLLLAALFLTEVELVGEEDSVAVSENVTISLEDADLANVLKTFAIEYKLNIVAGADVQGKVTVNLFDVPVAEALGRILAVNGFTLQKDGDFYLVTPIGDESGAEDLGPMTTAVVWLDYLTAEDALSLIDGMRSEDGRFTASALSDQGIDSDPTDAGGNDQAAGEVLVLLDYENVIVRVKKVLESLDRKPRQVLVEATILEVILDDTTSFGIDFNTVAGINFSDLGATSNLASLSLNDASPSQVSDGFASAGSYGFTSGTNSEGFHMGIVTNDVAIFIEALEKVTDTTVLANPRVLAVDRQPAEIIIGGKLGYQTSTTTETATIQQVEFLEVGTQLRFRPFISEDGFVRLEIHPESSTGVVSTTTGLPSETTTEVTTNVLVRDGNTIAIGGLIGETVETVTSQVPYLGSIPYLGALFRRTHEKVKRREVIVLLTPHIVDGGVTDEKALEQADAMANARDHLLTNQLPISRVRLSENYVLKAEKAMNEGRPSQALRYAEGALHFMPTGVRASKLRLRALAALGVEDEEARTLKELEGLR